MDIIGVDGGVYATLSRRNLEQLLESLDLEAWERPALVRMTDKGILSILAETNKEHYEGREPGDGLTNWLNYAADKREEESE